MFQVSNQSRGEPEDGELLAASGAPPPEGLGGGWGEVGVEVLGIPVVQAVSLPCPLLRKS